MSDSKSHSSTISSQKLRLLGLSYKSIAESLSTSDTTVRRVLLNLPGQWASAGLRKKIWEKVRTARKEAAGEIAKIEIPETV